MTKLKTEINCVSIMDNQLDKLEKENAKLKAKITKLEANIIEPQYKVGDIVLLDGYRKVKILKVYCQKAAFKWYKRVPTFLYEVENVQTEKICIKDNLGSTDYYFVKESFIVAQEELQDIPFNYETYLVHIIYNLKNKER